MNLALSLFDNSEDTNFNFKDKVRGTHSDELYIAICAQVGSNKEYVIESLKKQLNEIYNYDVRVIKLSSFIDEHQLDKYETISGKTEIYSSLFHKIKQGDLIRKNYNNFSILAELAIKEICNDRLNESLSTSSNGLPDPTDYKSRRVCYIIDSIKNKEELLLLRSIYEDLFYLISVFSPLRERNENLSLKGLAINEIEDIIGLDEYENNSYGQNVRNSFVEADFFMRVSKENIQNIDSKITRFLHLIFESAIITPLLEENAMYVAKSVAGNSSCLSRQVGASITDINGDVISKGWNDVPKFGGNLYQEGNLYDQRCKNLGYCSNDSQKDILVESIVDFIKDDEKLKELFNNSTGNFDFTLLTSFKSRLRKSKIKDLLEFSRSVHAEMHAIISGSQLSGNKMIGGKLFCTTYPCHNCARHIIVAGIKEVYYIEPYIKSLCLELHNDAITDNEFEENKVRILMYDGVAPRKYLNFFTNFAERKNEQGKLNSIDFEKISPKMSKSLQSIPLLEQQAIHSLEKCGLLNKD
jgi:deoxycytidylate deaminase